MIDHAARLDDDGYHRVKPAKKAYPEAKFVGETRMVHDEDDGQDWLEGDAIIVFDPEQEEQAWLQLKVGDAAYLTGIRKGRAAEIVRIDRIFAPADEAIRKKKGIWFFGTCVRAPLPPRAARRPPRGRDRCRLEGAHVCAAHC